MNLLAIFFFFIGYFLGVKGYMGLMFCCGIIGFALLLYNPKNKQQ